MQLKCNRNLNENKAFDGFFLVSLERHVYSTVKGFLSIFKPIETSVTREIVYNVNSIEIVRLLTTVTVADIVIQNKKKKEKIPNHFHLTSFIWKMNK